MARWRRLSLGERRRFAHGCFHKEARDIAHTLHGFGRGRGSLGLLARLYRTCCERRKRCQALRAAAVTSTARMG